MSAHTSTEKSSIWSLFNIIIGAVMGGITLLWVLAFVFEGLGSLVPKPKQEAPAAAAAPAAAPAATAAAAPAAPAANLPVLEVTIKPDSANPLAYDTKTISAKAGQKVKLTFNNTHPTLPQPHNFVLGKLGVDKGKMLNIAMAAMTLVDKGYIPESADILANTKLLQPGQSETIEFTLPTAGEYNYICTFPGHGAIMNGVITAQ
ncbi:plastocyanin/azurin family copper-binding protein [Prosthecobacter sp.]|uniref:plastocyanin/azurin family copper-binding protein n=1 Tax=Prosthecobacter sp. TaxID=1965333 RepID=UPI0037836A70